MMPANRILRENRAAIIPIAVVLIANIAVYALAVRPLRAKSAGAADRAAAARVAVASAEREVAAAQALVTGKTQAERELSTFYDKVLPASQSAARRMTYSFLPALASKARVRFQEARYDIDQTQKNQRIGRLHIRMVLEGEYDRIRDFIYDLETSQPFVIIDEVTLAQGDPTKPLLLTLDLSTYYRLEANGN